MIDLKAYGAFVENTIRPLLNEANQFINALGEKGIQVSEESIKRLLKEVAQTHIKIILLQSLRDIIIGAIVCLAIYQILR